MSQVIAEAHANIALAKYWGKADVALNLPAVPSLSLTLTRLRTRTKVSFEAKLAEDVVSLDKRRATPKEARRVVELLDRVRLLAGTQLYARVQSVNHFPTAAGLASSASGFAALALASTEALELGLSSARVSAIARQSSASAARSLFGGLSRLPAGRPGRGGLAATPLDLDASWLAMVIAFTAKGPKKVGSTVGMERSRKTSPLYAAWVEQAPKLERRLKRALAEQDLTNAGRLMEQSTFAFHGTALSASPAIRYWNGATMNALAAVEALRERGVEAYATMDAGPHVKVLCRASDSRRVSASMRRTEGVINTLVCKAGPAARIVA